MSLPPLPLFTCWSFVEFSILIETGLCKTRYNFVNDVAHRVKLWTFAVSLERSSIQRCNGKIWKSLHENTIYHFFVIHFVISYHIIPQCFKALCGLFITQLSEANYVRIRLCHYVKGAELLEKSGNTRTLGSDSNVHLTLRWLILHCNAGFGNSSGLGPKRSLACIGPYFLYAIVSKASLQAAR